MRRPETELRIEVEGLTPEGLTSDSDALATRAATLLPAQLLQGGEIIVLLLKPSPWFILLASLPTLIIIGILTVAAVVAHRSFSLGLNESEIVLFGCVLIVLRLFWQFVEWLSRVYVLTDRRIIRIRGVLRVSIFESPLQQIQHTNLLFSLRERVFVLGTIAFATAGTAAVEAAWIMIAKPLDVHQKVVETINRYKR